MHILIPLVLGQFVVQSYAVLHEATDLRDFDFIPFQKVDRYREYEKSRGKIEFQKDQMCPCGKELLNEMIFVYFDQFGRKGTVSKRLSPRRFLISQQQMGSGAFSRVYHGTPISDKNVIGECVAIKRPTSILNPDNHGHGIEQLNKEVKLLAKFSGAKHVIELKENLSFENYVHVRKPALIMERGVQNALDFCATAFLESQNAHEGKFLWILKQMLLGLKEVHENGYVYMDLKPQNMLIMPYPKISGQLQMDEVYLKLIDMSGIEKILPRSDYVKTSAKLTALTARYEAPETYTAADRNNLEITQAYDIWSFGISIIELLSNSEVFKAHLNNEEKRQQIYDEYLRGEMQLKTPQEIIYRLLLQRKHEIPSRKEMDEELEKFMQKMVLTTLARNVIADGKGPKYPGMQEIANDLDIHFGDTMKIVRICLKMKPEERPSAKDLLKLQIFKRMKIERIYDEGKSWVSQHIATIGMKARRAFSRSHLLRKRSAWGGSSKNT